MSPKVLIYQFLLHLTAIFIALLVQANCKENIKALHHWPFVKGIHWQIPLTKGQ